ncbi:hypothetical protein J6590_015249 [Homalodisca vitripennis]|nr:hypothetical protein J6590_015249 [Homalodisca vitripennis]
MAIIKDLSKNKYSPTRLQCRSHLVAALLLFRLDSSIDTSAQNKLKYSYPVCTSSCKTHGRQFTKELPHSASPYRFLRYTCVVVREIVVPKFYAGRAAYYALDIAILDLTKRVPVTSSFMPACVHWNTPNGNFFGSTGLVAGWRTTINETEVNTLITEELTPIDNAVCINKVRHAFQKLVTHDKFCAESKNGRNKNYMKL